eukprot:scaffold37076_cov66-Phaeocystis_antarctica.AAC.2
MACAPPCQPRAARPALCDLCGGGAESRVKSRSPRASASSTLAQPLSARDETTRAGQRSEGERERLEVGLKRAVRGPGCV